MECVILYLGSKKTYIKAFSHAIVLYSVFFNFRISLKQSGNKLSCKVHMCLIHVHNSLESVNEKMHFLHQLFLNFNTKIKQK